MTSTAPAIAVPQTTATEFTRPLVTGVGLLFAIDLAGAFTSMALGLNHGLMDALGNQARLSTPLPMIAAQAVLLFAATRRQRGLAIPATVLLGITGLLAFVSGFFDGSYAAVLATGPRLFQIVLVITALAVTFISAVRVARLSRR
ncbi:hypothetical protein J5X84_01570 [Streptosporangiaceae bacterium NEAU-GS5]|nr:hypothetical protein [Streptosporangiaceae bacterium NEAU-GS5]